MLLKRSTNTGMSAGTSVPAPPFTCSRNCSLEGTNDRATWAAACTDCQCLEGRSTIGCLFTHREHPIREIPMEVVQRFVVSTLDQCRQGVLGVAEELLQYDCGELHGPVIAVAISKASGLAAIEMGGRASSTIRGPSCRSCFCLVAHVLLRPQSQRTRRRTSQGRWTPSC
jgi:hypothetical protein